MKLPKWAVHRPIAATMLLAFFILLGCIGWQHMSIDLFPKIQQPYLIVSTHMENLGPSEIENQITIPLEKLFSTLPNIQSIHSTSLVGQSLITLKFQWGSNMKSNKENIQEKFEVLKSILPKNTPMPAILPFDPFAMPIMQWVIYQEGMEMNQTKKWIEQNVIGALQAIDGVATVTIDGVKERQIQICLNPEKIAQLHLDIEQIQNAIMSKLNHVPIGAVTEQNQVYQMQITSTESSLYDLIHLELPTSNGMIPLKEIAQIMELQLPKGHLAYINGKPCIGLSIFKESEKNTVEIANAVQHTLKKIQAHTNEPIQFESVFDQSQYIKQAISSVYSAIFWGGLFAAGILYIFLRNLQSTLIIFFTIPLAIVINFFGMYLFQQNLNLLTLGALSLGVGMMIDNAIVIVESIEQETAKQSDRKKSAIKGAMQVFQPMLASTLSSIVIFIPFLFIEGLVKQLFAPLAIVIILIQLTSLFVAFLFIPLIQGRKLFSFFSSRKNSCNRLVNSYKKILSVFMNHPKVVVFTCFFIFFASLWLIPKIDIEFLPHQDQSFIIGHIRCPEGSTWKHTEQTALKIFPVLEKTEGVQSVYATIGGAPDASFMEQVHENEANFYCLLKKKTDRSLSDQEIVKKIEAKLKQISNLSYTLSASDPGFFDSNIKIRILSSSRDKTIQAMKQIKPKLEGVSGLSQIHTEGSDFVPMLSLIFQEEKATLLGIDRIALAMQLQAIINGKEIYRIQDQKEEIPIRIFLRKQSVPPQSNELAQLPIFTTDKGFVTVGQLTTIQKTRQISKQSRYNQQAQTLLTAETNMKNNREIFQTLQKILSSKKDANHSVQVILDGQMQQIKTGFKQMSFVCLLAILFIYMILAAQFESLLVPFILICSVPVISIGIISALIVFHYPLSAASFIGILLLIGVVVNNAILLLDSVMQRMQNGQALKEAVLNGAPTRIRPIFMTAATTILGVLPLFIGSGEGIEFERPMSVVIIFGLISSTFITLVLIPSLLILFEKPLTRIWKKHQPL